MIYSLSNQRDLSFEKIHSRQIFQRVLQLLIIVFDNKNNLTKSNKSKNKCDC